MPFFKVWVLSKFGYKNHSRGLSIDFIVNFINRYLEFSEETMGRKKIKKNKGKPFVSGDPRSNFGSPCNDFESEPRIREPKSVFDKVILRQFD